MGGIRMNNKDQHTEVSCERMVNKNKSTQKSEMIRCRYRLVRQREIVLFAVIQPTSPTLEKKDIGKLNILKSCLRFIHNIIYLFTYIFI